MDKFFLWVQMGTYLFIYLLQLLLFCEKNLLEKYLARQLIMPSCLVVKQNFPNTNVIVNYFNFRSNRQMFVRCWAYNMK